MICPICKRYTPGPVTCRHTVPADSTFVKAKRCPDCGSLDTELFTTHVDDTLHCRPCGKVFK